MAEKTFWFLYGSEAIALPVTPKSYTWAYGKRVETVNISTLGDVSLAGKPTRYSGKIECLFPARLYPWVLAGAFIDPTFYINRFTWWAKSREPVRYLVTGAAINSLVLITSLTYEEKDGSGDVYAVIGLQEWIDLEAATVSNLGEISETEGAALGTGGTGNSGQNQTSARRQYTVAAGDMLSVLCRRFYGDGSARYYNALARYNGIKNPHLIYPGTELTIPPAGELLGG